MHASHFHIVHGGLRHLRFSRDKREFLQRMIEDCVLFDLSERDALYYIEQRFGYKITRRYYEMLKQKVKEDPEAQKWLNDFARIGFIVEHKRRFDEMAHLQQKMFQELLRELKRPECPKKDAKQPRNVMAILAIAAQITRQSKRLQALQNGTPIIAKVAAMLEQQVVPGGITVPTEAPPREALLDNKDTHKERIAALEKAMDDAKKLETERKEKHNEQKN